MSIRQTYNPPSGGNSIGGGLVFYGSGDLDGGKFAKVGSNHVDDSDVQPAVIPRDLTVTRVTITSKDAFVGGSSNTLIIRKNGSATAPIASLAVTQQRQVFVVNLALVQGDLIHVSGTNSSGTKMKDPWISLS